MSDKPGKNSDAWLEDEASVSRAYRELDQLQPPKHLDDAILAEARRAATGPDDNIIRLHHWRKWTMPAALAATAIFAIPLVVRVFNTAPELELNRARTTMADKTLVESELASRTQGSEELPEQEAGAADPRAMLEEPQLARQAASPAEDLLDRLVEEKRIAQSALGVAANSEREANDDSAPSAAAMTREPDNFSYEKPGDAANESGDQQLMGSGQTAYESRFADAPPVTVSGHVADSQAQPSRAPASDSAASRHPDYRRLAALSSNATAADSADQAGSSMPVAKVDRQQDIDERQEVIVTANRDVEPWLEPTQWLEDISRLHERGQPEQARRALGTFYSVYPDYRLPPGFPLRPKDALLDKPAAYDSEIVPEAGTWLRGIGLMAYRGDIDEARTQLARFVRIYPDYPLPEDFPLSRDDARPIEQ